jgi:predicted negative regulator of RcsB-dependent stress response
MLKTITDYLKLNAKCVLSFFILGIFSALAYKKWFGSHSVAKKRY